MTQGLCSEVQAANEPEQALGGFVLLAANLSLDKSLEGGGLGGCGLLALANLGNVALDVGFDGLEGSGSENVYER